jgi:aminoglycoside 6-adenylyltransferase
MRTEQEMFDLILNFAKNDESIRAVILNGSRANPNAPKDIFQDFDIACLVKDMNPYLRNANIPPYFGEILILQEPENMGEPSPEDAGSYAYLMQFMDGNRIDLSFHAPEKWKFVTSDSQSIVLLDKDNALGELPPASDVDYWARKPTNKQFQDCCNEFWWMNPYVAKGLWRGEFTYAKWMMEVVQEQLLDMLTWYFGIKTDFKKAPGKQGKYIRAYVQPDIWAELERTFSDANVENNWESLFIADSLFRRVAKVVAEQFGFQYPQQDDDNVSRFIRRIKSLPRDAKEI